MKQLFITAIFLVLPLWSTESEFFMSDEFIQRINNQKAWTAKRYFNSSLTLDRLKLLTGIKTREPSNSEVRMSRIKSFENLAIRKHFDASKKWESCKYVINEIRSQGFCASSWAFSAAEVMADRTCIQSNGKIKIQYSPEDLVSCCDSCGGCKGIENITDVWEFFQNPGVVSGGDYQERYIRKWGCKPYSNSSFDGVAATCQKSCQYSKINYEDDKRCIIKSYTHANNIRQIQKEIMTNGPVQAVFDVYADFLHYKSGVYFRLDKNETLIGRHAVKILGWGEDYWLAANSWGSGWGDRGRFKILKGMGECGIEDNIIWPNVDTTKTCLNITTTTTASTNTTTTVPITTTTTNSTSTAPINTTTTTPTTTTTNTATAPTNTTTPNTATTAAQTTIKDTTSTTPTTTTTATSTTTPTSLPATISTITPHSGAIDVRDSICRVLAFSSFLYLL